jgi:hypothetical protein
MPRNRALSAKQTFVQRTATGSFADEATMAV